MKMRTGRMPVVRKAQMIMGLISRFLDLFGYSRWNNAGVRRHYPHAMEPDMKLDARTKRNIETLLPAVQGDFIAFALAAKRVAQAHGCDYIGIQGTRTMEEQRALYAKGRTSPGPKVTNARPGYSWHNFGRALDFGVFRDGKYLDAEDPAMARKVHAACGEIAKTYGLEWGGSWRTFQDAPHYQRVPANLSLAEARRSAGIG
jgi:peptidoglycan LD-endopeptidase CwlK